MKVNLRLLGVFRANSGPNVLKPVDPDTGSWRKAIGERLWHSGTKLRENVDKAGVQTSKCGPG